MKYQDSFKIPSSELFLLKVQTQESFNKFDQLSNLDISKYSEKAEIMETSLHEDELNTPKIPAEETNLNFFKEKPKEIQNRTFIKTKRGKKSRLPKQAPAVENTDEHSKTVEDWSGSLVVNSCSVLRRDSSKTDRKVKSKEFAKSPKFSEFTDEFALQVTGL